MERKQGIVAQSCFDRHGAGARRGKMGMLRLSMVGGLMIVLAGGLVAAPASASPSSSPLPAIAAALAATQSYQVQFTASTAQHPPGIEVGTYTVLRRGGPRIDAVLSSRPSGAGQYTIVESVTVGTRVCQRLAAQLPLLAKAAFTCTRDPGTAKALAQVVDPSKSLAAPGTAVTFSRVGTGTRNFFGKRCIPYTFVQTLQGARVLGTLYVATPSGLPCEEDTTGVAPAIGPTTAGATQVLHQRWVWRHFNSQKLTIPAVPGATAPSLASWHAVPSGTTHDLYGVACPDTEHCVVVGDKGTILAAGDGGGSWRALHSGTNATLYAVSCPTVSACYAVGANATIVGTTDGGATWHLQGRALQGNLGGDLRGIACANAGSCVAVGSQTPGNIIVTTADAGATWQNNTSGDINDLYGVACPTGRTCYAVGGNDSPHTTAVTAHSDDAGRTWSSDNNGVSDTGVPLSALACPGPTTCYAAGTAGTMVGTTDGRSWPLLSSGTGSDLAALACSEPRACYAAGTGGTIVGTTDGGQTWHAQHSGTGADLNGLACSDAQSCYAVGTGGTILTRH
jgi:photosystem II stability/assembly factor-like uncharacterized protein